MDLAETDENECGNENKMEKLVIKPVHSVVLVDDLVSSYDIAS